jgi:nucleoside-diphosphate-sugar epimerase
MKILHVVPFFHGGVGFVALNLSKEFAKMGHEVVLATPSKLPVELEELVARYFVLRTPSLRDRFTWPNFAS